MTNVSTNEFKQGLKVILDKDPCIIVENVMVKPGKGQAFNRVKLRNLLTGRTLEKTFKSGESIPKAEIIETEYQYSYTDGTDWYFMHPESFEQIAVDANTMAGAEKWLKGQEICLITLWNDNPISITAPNFVELKIIESEPAVRGDSSGNVTKPAIVETGAEIKVPLFVDSGEVVKIDTRTGEYSARVKS